MKKKERGCDMNKKKIIIKMNADQKELTRQTHKSLQNTAFCSQVYPGSAHQSF